MNSILLSQYDGAILGPIARVLGWIMNGIFWVLDKIGIPNIGLAIILFTIVIYLLLMPLTIRQQKFSKLSAKMNPELQAIQKRYAGKKDNESMMAMNQETKEVYAKYGVSPTGSCVQLLIQMPILFALYRVFSNVPAYVAQVKEAFFPLVEKLVNTPGATEFLSNSENFTNGAMYARQFANEAFTSGNVEYMQNTFIDVLYKASTAEWNNLAANFPDLASEITSTMERMDRYNNFLGLNMGNPPAFMVSEAISTGAWLMVIAALAIPVLSAVTQWLNVKLMPQADTGSDNDKANSMMASMKMMNNIMPIMSAVFCYTLPAGMGLYWIAGSVVRSVQQVAINKHIDKMDIDAEIKKNVEKHKEKLRKKGIDPEKLNSYATMSTRNVKPQSPAPAASSKTKASAMTQEEKDEAVRKATEYYNKNAAKPGSLAAKANMVKDYNERNNRK